MIYHYPKFYYRGNKYHTSDRRFIESKLELLNEQNQKTISDFYTNVFLHYINRGQPNEARAKANGALMQFIGKYGVDEKQVEKIRSMAKCPSEITARIEALKSIQKNARPHINLGG